MKDREIRHMTVGKLELRAAGEGKMPTICGYAAVYNSLSEDMGFRELVAPGAFTRALKEGQDVRALVNHNDSMILGRTKSGTLMLRDDTKGLYMEVQSSNTSYCRDLVESIARGDIDQMSFSFACKRDSWGKMPGTDMQMRTLLDLDLYDVSPVTFPSYTDTSVGLRSLERHQRATGSVSADAMRKARLYIAKAKI